jgi:lipooligosaccharide transport system ATP-binding protein
MVRMDDNSIIRVEHVRKSYGETVAVDNMSFTVGPAVCFGLLGPNGAGKTTMMKMIYGKSQRDDCGASRISVFGYDPCRDELSIKFIAGVVPQDNNLDEELNVEQNLRVFSRFYALSRREAGSRIGRLLEFMELGEKRRARIRELSGGMQRRLIIARALLNDPRLLILDEPTTGLDPQVRHLIWDRIRSLKKQGLSILLTTHYMEEAFQICDSVLIMDKGKRMLEGEPRALVRDNIEQYVLEVINPDAAAGMRLEEAGGVRVDTSGGALRVHADTVDTLRSIAAPLEPGDYLVRHANLEDLFLKITGRQLHEQQ